MTGADKAGYVLDKTRLIMKYITLWELFTTAESEETILVIKLDYTLFSSFIQLEILVFFK